MGQVAHVSVVDSDTKEGCLIRVVGTMSYREVFDLKDWVTSALRVHPFVCLDLTHMNRTDRAGAELLQLLKSLGGGRIVVFDGGPAGSQDKGESIEETPLSMHRRDDERLFQTQEVR